MKPRTEMETKLFEAVMTGSVLSLNDLLQQDPLLLDRSLVSLFSETPLHVASMLGHFDLVKVLLSFKPEFASELDSTGSSPLHLASAKGYHEIVKLLLLSDSETSMVRNQDGYTPLHMAVMKGRVKVLNKLVQVKRESIWTLTDRRETVLHLCVGRNWLDGLKVLIETTVDCKGYELLNWKDSSGNTILHIAVSKKQIEIIKVLLDCPGLDVNAQNSNGSTALDILMSSPRDLRDMDIHNSLLKFGALSSKNLNSIVQESFPIREHQILTKPLSLKIVPKERSFKKPVVKHKQTDWLGRKRSALMVVASLIATVAFQASITPPGGVWADGNDGTNNTSTEKPHTVGTSVMAFKQPKEYGIFMIFNTIAFLASLSIILLLVSGLPIKRRRWMWIQMVIMWIAITAQVATYFLSFRHMSPKDNDVQSMLKEVTEISVLTWLCLMGLVFIGNLVRMNLWILRKYGCIKPKEAVPSTTVDDEDEDEEEL